MSRPLVGRLATPGHAVIALNDRQRAAATVFEAALRAGELTVRANPCLCGASEDVDVAHTDRYGFAVRTVLCRNCGLMRTDPYLDEASVVRFYEQHYRAVYSDDADAPPSLYADQYEHGRQLLQFAEDAGVSITGTVLDVGCGAGGILQPFRERGCRVAGCDYGEALLEYGRAHDLCLEHGDATALLSYAPAQMVILSHVLEHFLDPIAELQKVGALLDSDGVLLIEVPGLYWIEHYYAGDFAMYLQNAHVYYFCLQSLDYVMARAGFNRIAGTELVRAVYRKEFSVSAPVADRELCARIVAHLKKLEWNLKYRSARARVFGRFGRRSHQVRVGAA